MRRLRKAIRSRRASLLQPSAGQAKFINQGPGDGVRLDVELAFQQCCEPIIALERLGPAAGGRQAPDDEAMGILPQFVHRNGPAGSFERALKIASTFFRLAEPNQRVDGETFEAVSPGGPPFPPALPLGPGVR